MKKFKTPARDLIVNINGNNFQKLIMENRYGYREAVKVILSDFEKNALLNNQKNLALDLLRLSLDLAKTDAEVRVQTKNGMKEGNVFLKTTKHLGAGEDILFVRQPHSEDVLEKIRVRAYFLSENSKKSIAKSDEYFWIKAEKDIIENEQTQFGVTFNSARVMEISARDLHNRTTIYFGTRRYKLWQTSNYKSPLEISDLNLLSYQGYYQAIELYFKSFLKQRGIPTWTLRDLNHNLYRLAKKSSKLGLNLSKKIIDNLKVVQYHYDEIRYTRAGFNSLPRLSSIEWLAFDVRSALITYIRQCKLRVAGAYKPYPRLVSPNRLALAI